MLRNALIALVVICCGGAVTAAVLGSKLAPFDPAFTAAASRPCLFPAGGWATVDCSNSAAARSGALNYPSRYVIQCGVDSYVAWGGDAVTADNADGILVDSVWLQFVTDATSRYVSCLNISSDSDCRVIECR